MIIEQVVELWPLALGLLAAGLIAGVLAGLLGVGGGIVLVPVLFQVLTILEVDEGVRMHVAVATSLATIIPTTIRSLMKHNERGAVDFGILRAWAPGIVVGVIAAAFIADVASGQTMILIFAIFVLAFAANLAFVSENWRIGENVPVGAGGLSIAGLMGGISSLMGIGGGTVGVTALTLYGLPIHRAVATAAGFGLVIAVPGTMGYMISGWGEPLRPSYSLGYVNLIGFALIVPATWAATPIGVRIAHALERATLRRVFAIFLVIASVRMFWELLG